MNVQADLIAASSGGDNNRSIARFLGQLYVELARKTPLRACASCLLFLTSQLSMLGAMLLPWKVLLLLTTASRLAWLPGQTIEQQIALLMAAILGAFLTHLGCELGITWICGNCADTILRAHDKTGLFTRYQQSARSICKRLLKALAAGVFCALACLWIALSYPLLCAALVSYMTLSLVFIREWHGRASTRIGRARSPTRPLLFKAWWHLGFIDCLCWVLWDYWHRGTPAWLVVFINLLLVRQILMSSLSLWLDLAAVVAQKPEAEALFIRHATWQPREAGPDPDIEAMTAPTARATLLAGLLGTHDVKGTLEDVTIRTAGSGALTYLKGGLLDGGESPTRSVILKLSSRSREAATEHEAQLLKVAEPHWPAPRLLAEGRLQRVPFLLMAAPGDIRWLDLAERRRASSSLRHRLLACELPAPIVERYDRSHPTLSEKLARISWSRLRALAADSAALEACDRLEGQWADVIAELASLPRQLTLPLIHARMTAAATNGDDIHICDWSNWSWLPAGSAWPLRKQTRQELAQALDEARKHRPVFAAISPRQVHLSALLYDFRKNYAERRYGMAANQITTITNTFEN